MGKEATDVERQIWNALNERRGRGSSTGIEALAEVLEELNVSVSTAFVNELARRSGRLGGEFTVPAALTAFVTAFAAQRPRSRVTDPWCQLGQLATAATRSAPNAKVRGVTPRQALIPLLNHLDAHVEWAVGRADVQPDLLGTDNDLVVCAPPFNATTDGSRLSADGASELATRLLERSCDSLSNDGDALFVLSPSSWARSGSAGWRERLVKSGFAVRACYWIPSRTFEPLTAIPSVFVHVARGEQRELFVAELPSDEASTRIVFDNFSRHRQAPDARLGRWLPLDEFHSLPRLVASERLQQLGRRAGQACKLGDIAAVREWKPEESPSPNLVLLPADGTASRAAILASDAGEAKGRHFAIEPREDAAVPEYLARYLSSELGQLARETAATGAVVSKLSIEALRDVTVYLPEARVQRATVETHARITTLINELRELDDRLWAKPKAYEEVGAALSKVNHEDRFEVWLETLPFPLATVLWLYVTQRSPKDRVDTLLHFFEAYAEFWATAILSLFLRDPARRTDRQAQVQAVLSKQNQSLEMASFGTWLTLVELLAKEGRELRGKPDEAMWLKREAALADERFFDVLLSKDALRILRAVNSLRNSWKGHGGIVTDDVAAGRLSVLAGHLAELRGILGERWSGYVLYRIGSFEFRDGIYVAQAERVVGTRAPFTVDAVELTGPAETGRLHLVGTGARDALPLLPFIKVMPSPRTAMNACYFYNRKTKEGVRFVSYHFAEDSDVTDRFDDTAREVESLTRSA